MGMPDLVGYIRPGKLGATAPVPVYIEAKRPGGRRRPMQERFIQTLQEDGVLAFFARSVDAAVDELNKRGVPIERPRYLPDSPTVNRVIKGNLVGKKRTTNV